MDNDNFGQQPAAPRLDANQQIADQNFANLNAPPAFAPTVPSAQLPAAAPVEKKSPLKLIIMVVAGVVLVAAAGGGGFFAGKSAGFSAGQKSEQEKFQKIVAQQNADKEKAESVKLNLEELVDPEYKDETIEGEISKQAQASDGFVLLVKNIERNFKTDDPNVKIDPTKELIKVNFIIGNADKNKAKDIDPYKFRLENSSGLALTPENVSDYEGKFESVTLQPGDQTEKSIVYSVNKDEKPLTFIRSQLYRITNQNKEYTTIIKVPVAKK